MSEVRIGLDEDPEASSSSPSPSSNHAVTELAEYYRVHGGEDQRAAMRKAQQDLDDLTVKQNSAVAPALLSRSVPAEAALMVSPFLALIWDIVGQHSHWALLPIAMWASWTWGLCQLVRRGGLCRSALVGTVAPIATCLTFVTVGGSCSLLGALGVSPTSALGLVGGFSLLLGSLSLLYAGITRAVARRSVDHARFLLYYQAALFVAMLPFAAGMVGGGTLVVWPVATLMLWAVGAYQYLRGGIQAAARAGRMMRAWVSTGMVVFLAMLPFTGAYSPVADRMLWIMTICAPLLFVDRVVCGNGRDTASTDEEDPRRLPA
jgi:hypothetical protein